MTISQLKYVLSVAEYHNFTIAAEHSFVTQPTLSMQIQKLEEELEVKIFNRSKKPIELTEVGKRIVEQAKVIVDESNRIIDIVHQQKGYIGGEFKLGIIPTVMPTLLPMFLNNFTKKYPKVKLIVEELTTEEIVRKLTDGHIDAAIAATPLENEAIKERPLYYEPFVGLIPEGHRLFNQKLINVDELEMDDILLLEDGHCFKDSIINLCRTYKNNGCKHFQLESGSFSTLIKLSKEGLGMTLLPYLHTLDLNKEDKSHLREFTSPPPAREVSLIYHKSQLKMQLIKALKEIIDSVVRGAISFSDVKIISPLHKKQHAK
ncbi:hydrogen peroxide-inducible genes activator [Tenacibaculum maritimum]|uniref:Transcriptional activator, LysR family n=1 Tax=Tenacibaculum maritimum NCIMB 2154 TaxID=1349785 RepID=A0A2H1E9Q3_9FLAO|nr:hydrogen peroxide-inducible genes activator [Tenacibaculum maritimum]MCD9563361.1 hydrogen peroxide-inducible genes activator [Tenacibaculum maritimum]MCD9566256.1 hydrogen peroxide-inducible genes activator [Tenacibaculum maritimum]MCD9578716.1 hydrogen peroxide-inducible genes activator [Tenacibaculum maritimum]MCD9582432.1 hydrogen peroxide-inducible genes activator [Tenacibaculum maritimum]MCD9584551.1 hydrogen peroxide-inducible genes activator [Tenacibaculum maritimum]